MVTTLQAPPRGRGAWACAHEESEFASRCAPVGACRSCRPENASLFGAGSRAQPRDRRRGPESPSAANHAGISGVSKYQLVSAKRLTAPLRVEVQRGSALAGAIPADSGWKQRHWQDRLRANISKHGVAFETAKQGNTARYASSASARWRVRTWSSPIPNATGACD